MTHKKDQLRYNMMKRSKPISLAALDKKLDALLGDFPPGRFSSKKKAGSYRLRHAQNRLKHNKKKL